MRINTQLNTLISTTFTATNGTSPYAYRFVNLPSGASSYQNVVNLTMNSEGSYTFGVYVTDFSGLINYFSVFVISTRSVQNILGYIENVTSSYTDNRTGQRITIYNVPQSDLIPGFVVQSPSSQSFTISDVTTNRAISTPTVINLASSSSSYIRTANRVNNRNPCPENSQQTIEGSGTITAVNPSHSTIQLNNRIILTFKDCTLQAFRGRSQSFENGNFVSYQGILDNNSIDLLSITNTS